MSDCSVATWAAVSRLTFTVHWKHETNALNALWVQIPVHAVLFPPIQPLTSGVVVEQVSWHPDGGTKVLCRASR